MMIWVRTLAHCAAVTAATVMAMSIVYADKTVDDKGFIRLKPGEEVWTPYPNSDWKYMVIEGDPKKPGPYVLRYKVPSK